MKIKKALSAILAVIIIFSFTCITTSATDGHSGFKNMEKLSKQEIVNLTKTAPISDTSNIYSSVPSIKAPYSIGKVNDEIMQSGIVRINAYRRLAGLKSVTLNGVYTNYAQTGALVLATNNAMTHYPTKPADMSQDMFDNGYKGTSKSNLVHFHSWPTEEGPFVLSVDVCMDDSDSKNISTVGHRRWLLNPAMGKTGFGVADNNGDRYSAIYALDKSATVYDYDFISWPPSGYMVSDSSLFSVDVAWSVSLNPEKYSISDVKDITVEMKGEEKTYNFSYNKADGFFNVDTNSYAIPNAIIFLPDNISEYTGEYIITIKGIKTSSGIDTTLSYSVEFFKAKDADRNTSVPAVDDTGDINEDGKISAADARLALRIAARMDSISEDKINLADVNNDNAVTAADARIILRVSAKLDTF